MKKKNEVVKSAEVKKVVKTTSKEPTSKERICMVFREYFYRINKPYPLLVSDVTTSSTIGGKKISMTEAFHISDAFTHRPLVELGYATIQDKDGVNQEYSKSHNLFLSRTDKMIPENDDDLYTEMKEWEKKLKSPKPKNPENKVESKVEDKLEDKTETIVDVNPTKPDVSELSDEFMGENTSDPISDLKIKIRKHVRVQRDLYLINKQQDELYNSYIKRKNELIAERIAVMKTISDLDEYFLNERNRLKINKDE